MAMVRIVHSKGKSTLGRIVHGKGTGTLQAIRS